jgi:hypothetical protein
MEARSVGEGVLVRGRVQAQLELECRRCVTAVQHWIDEEVDILYEVLDEEEEDELAGEVYPLPRGGTISTSDRRCGSRSCSTCHSTCCATRPVEGSARSAGRT